MASSRMSLNRLTKKPRHPSSTCASTELQDIGGLLRKSPSLLRNPTPDAQSINSQTTCPLLSLPIEIRREIYRYVLPRPKPNMGFRFMHDGGDQSVTSEWGAKRNGRTSSRHRLAILTISRQIYIEALSILYSENLFHFVTFSYTPVLELLRRLSPDARSRMRQIRLTLVPPGQAEACEKEGEHDTFCTVIHDACPGLVDLMVDPSRYM
ncbi:hypothetical protein EJ05DRAFT_377084 [Pseudovirgaria hyperparasitica]|uniref:DUF7730 domain-containing protein n=1 Tax=Pseudovirgaria hyperparasitica TaxID=470096 RepID=A0A6A6W663_9PEZI|nr:uncharacterized protein EJ05DRAFT_377084 [Pseudovirgaria hyperparasitica]KAF2758103.1 hypothetical protein EJ05DRAFT_377084 [Pseudovirgaria hyperparasitica]